MTTCARAVLQSDGSYLLALDLSITDVSTCPYVVQTGAESALGSLLDLTPDQALVISTQVALIWAICWGFKQVRRSIGVFENETSE